MSVLEDEARRQVLLEVSDVARELCLSVSMIHKMLRRGKIHPFAMTRRGSRLFTVEEVERVREERAEGKR